MNLWNKFVNLFFPCLTKKPERARYMDGRLKADDKKTPNITEAWKGGNAPAKKRGRPPKAKKRGRPPKKK